MRNSRSPKQIYGLIGYPVKHSLSPAMHNAAFKHLNIDAEYRLFEITPAQLEDFLLKNIEVKDTQGKSFYSQNVRGFNITIPHKVPSLLKNTIIRKYPDVILTGAVNTVKREDGKLHYRNTDTVGFVKSLIEDLRFNLEDKNVFLFGCGGAGRAVIAGLTEIKPALKKIYIYDISKDSVESAEKHFSNLASNFDSVKGKLQFISTGDIPKIIQSCQLLINASPVGMKDDDGSIIDKNLLHEDLSVYDVVYHRKTQLIKDAESRGRPAKDGLGMLLYQGAEAFKFWTGQKAPVEVMRRALEEEIKKCRN